MKKYQMHIFLDSFKPSSGSKNEKRLTVKSFIQDLLHRYVRGYLNVLCVRKSGL